MTASASPRAVAERFYSAFARRDGDAMAACYAPDARFSDPVFPDLQGDRVGAMWRMLCKRGADLRVDWRVLDADDGQARVRWDAYYTFSITGRKVHNVITSRLVVRDGAIVEQRDDFDFWRWSRMALGPVGWLLGWTPIVQGKVRAQAGKGLAEFVARPA